jgi:hypothetical protein
MANGEKYQRKIYNILSNINIAIYNNMYKWKVKKKSKEKRKAINESVMNRYLYGNNTQWNSISKNERK